MGGGGSYYDRDTTSSNTRTSRGFSADTENLFRRQELDPSVLTRDRKITISGKTPIVYGLDGTGSMGDLPLMIFERAPNLVRQIVDRRYLDLESTRMVVSLIGDITMGDSAPIQVVDPVALRNLDDAFKKLWRDGCSGGGNSVESYETMAWFFANKVEMPEAEMPFCIFTADEGFYDQTKTSELKEFFGGKCEKETAKEVFAQLREKFMGNVYLIHRFYSDTTTDAKVVKQWQSVLGKDHVIILEDDGAIVDITLGLLAVAGGTKTLDEYCEDMRQRTNVDTGELEPQSERRIISVRKSLAKIALATKKTIATGTSTDITTVNNNESGETTETDPVPEPKKKGGRRSTKKAPADQTKDWKL